MSTPYTLGYLTGGEAEARYTCQQVRKQQGGLHRSGLTAERRTTRCDTQARMLESISRLDV
jgi:hypothetical protein